MCVSIVHPALLGREHEGLLTQQREETSAYPDPLLLLFLLRMALVIVLHCFTTKPSISMAVFNNPVRVGLVLGLS